jgi:hypothetical protein
MGVRIVDPGGNVCFESLHALVDRASVALRFAIAV